MGVSISQTPLDEVEFLARSAHRVTILNALASHPRSRRDLQTMTDVSRSTIRRTLRAFEDRNWIIRNGQYYETTQLGTFVAAGMQELIDQLETEQTLRAVWNWLPDNTDGFTIEMVADAVVMVAEADDPYRPVNRFTSLLRQTDRLQFAGFGLALLEPCKETLSQQIIDGMETEIIEPPHVVEHIRSTYSESFAAALASGNLVVRIHDTIPRYGIGLFDDRIAISGYDQHSGMIRVLIDTDTPEAREWAESRYETIRHETHRSLSEDCVSDLSSRDTIPRPR